MCLSHLVDPYKAYQHELVAAGLLIPLGVRGVYGCSGTFEHIIERFESYVTRMGAHFNPEVIRFPPVFARASYEQTGHIHNFPDLLGSIHGFLDGDREHREMVEKLERKDDWSAGLRSADVMMVPAACYPLYPTVTGTLPPGGRRVDLKTYAFRREPSDDPARMQSFRMREYVRLGTPQEALEHRDYWLEHAQKILEAVGLEAKPVVANDPFFGRGARVMKATQREQTLKFELVVSICSDEKPTAVASCNYHVDHFGVAFDIRTAEGKTAHSACVGFGLERVCLALLKTHGFNPDLWPREVRQILALR
jgi:seryl-tRNA synthetase